MFRGLRGRLTLTYGLAALAVVAVMGAGSCALVQHYFRADNDAALRYRMAIAFAALGSPVPRELTEARREWEQRHGRVDSVEASTTAGLRSPGMVDSELAPLYLIPLSPQGKAISSGAEGPQLPPPADDGVLAAATRPDIRTVGYPDGRRARVLTYALRPPVISSELPMPIGYLQAGRLLADQDHLLAQLLLAVLLLSAGISVAVGLVAWYLAGRSLAPARRAWENQRVFVANASHELRAPVTLIRAFAEYGLREPTREPDTVERESLRDVLTETNHLTGLIDDLILLSRLDASRLELAREPVVLANLISEVAHAFGLLAAEKGVALEVGTTEGTVRGDHSRLRQALLILLDNALRYTAPDGSIRLESRSEDARVTITVTDTGVGISPEDLPRVFERFFQSTKSRGDEASGSGLGLSIAKALVEAQGGRISLASTVGIGTEVTLTLQPGGTA